METKCLVSVDDSLEELDEGSLNLILNQQTILCCNYSNNSILQVCQDNVIQILDYFILYQLIQQSNLFIQMGFRRGKFYMCQCQISDDFSLIH